VAALLIVAGVGVLTILSVVEAPPPQEAVVVDQAAALYASNCANCHGSSIDVPSGTDLHQIIASGTHEGMPAWGGDLSTDEIDQLAGFVLSPNGSALYVQQCEACHEQMVQAVGNPVEIQRVIDEGSSYSDHEGLDVSEWSTTLSSEEQNTLLNFLAAPDGQRLFAVNCAGCHGQGVAFSGTEEELQVLINEGGQHLTMPAWKGTLIESDLDTLAAYVTDPISEPDGESLFGQHCASCHGDNVPPAPDKDTARKIISTGGTHMTMPIWGDILTTEQLNALTTHTFDASKGTGSAAGAQLYTDYCASCHGQFGEGGPNPARADDVIAPISSAEYLKTRDDVTLRNIISRGQPDFGMSPFGDTNGGPLDDEQVDTVVAFIRSWEANPPVEFPPEIVSIPPSAPEQPALSGSQVFASVCASCHGPDGEGGLGPALNTDDFQDRYDDQTMFDTINNGHEATPMIAWGDIITSDQITQLVQYIRAFNAEETSAGSVSYSGQIAPIFQTQCQACHNQQTALGGWDSTSYQTVINTGNSGAVVIPGDSVNSVLAQRVSGTQGALMPPAGKMSDTEIQLILDWIAAGALDN